MFVRDSQSPDVIGVGLARPIDGVINPSKKQWLIANGQLVQSRQGGRHDDVPLDQVTGTAHIRHRGAVAQGARFVTHVVEGPQREIEEGLFPQQSHARAPR